MRGSISSILARAGINVVSRSDRLLLETVRRDLLPGDIEPDEEYLPSRRIGSEGLDLDPGRQKELLGAMKEHRFEALFESLRNDDQVNTGLGGVDFRDRGLIHNGYYPTPDAELYGAMIMLAGPERIIEVGSGYSTVIARRTVEKAGLDCEIHVIDPLPRRDIEDFADRIEYEPVEKSSLAGTLLEENTLLFIDSSHVCRSGGDLPFLYCRILPGLPAGVLVHVHDIFIPFDYPANYVERFYNEQYLLHALLAGSDRFEVAFATHYMTREHRENMQAVFGGAVGEDPLFHGASFWFRSREKPSRTGGAEGRP